MPFNKRLKSTHRCHIIDANGDAFVTVPIEKPESMSKAKWTDINVSAHGSWWNIAVTALRSAYGRTPFFEFYIDDFLPMLSSASVGHPLMELDTRLDTLLRRLFLINSQVFYGNPTEIVRKNAIEAPLIDYRSRKVDFITNIEYYQLRALKHGFQPGLSAIDLLFNLGPEAPMILRRMNS